jgi:DNA-binding MarR family transcriptional regulator
VLLTLKEALEQRLRLSELAEKALFSRSNLIHLVDRLEKAGLLRRERCAVVYSEGIAKYFGCHLNDQELQVVERVLKQMIAAASS